VEHTAFARERHPGIFQAAGAWMRESGSENASGIMISTTFSHARAGHGNKHRNKGVPVIRVTRVKAARIRESAV